MNGVAGCLEFMQLSLRVGVGMASALPIQFTVERKAVSWLCELHLSGGAVSLACFLLLQVVLDSGIGKRQCHPAQQAGQVSICRAPFLCPF